MKTPEEIMREAEALIRQTEESLAATSEVLRAHGLDEQKFSSMDRQQQAEAQAEAQALFRQDMEDIEREVAQEAARLSFANATPRVGGTRKMRNMI
jgi:hypothetical protein